MEQNQELKLLNNTFSVCSINRTFSLCSINKRIYEVLLAIENITQNTCMYTSQGDKYLRFH